jgi:hypothetical protein
MRYYHILEHRLFNKDSSNISTNSTQEYKKTDIVLAQQHPTASFSHMYFHNLNGILNPHNTGCEGVFGLTTYLPHRKVK